MWIKAGEEGRAGGKAMLQENVPVRARDRAVIYSTSRIEEGSRILLTVVQAVQEWNYSS